ncbi:hypothetical protein GBAR_LOCUS27391 [Geodia barretti]|uniref:Uncharacterized protein n=1 Tax=Geodia barretti TaxID=519541 RepID=A0AA35TMI0_GEOBA|nr:hypothetical protein GBAR_LOCUS27391 [Geodia barretti]
MPSSPRVCTLVLFIGFVCVCVCCLLLSISLLGCLFVSQRIRPTQRATKALGVNIQLDGSRSEHPA